MFHSDFYSFYLLGLFLFVCFFGLFQDPIQDATLHLMSMPPLAPLGCNSFSGFCCFWWPWQFGELNRYFGDVLHLGFVWCLPHYYTGVMVFGEEDHRGTVSLSSQYTEGTCFLSRWLMIVDVDHNHLAEIGFVIFFSK